MVAHIDEVQKKKEKRGLILSTNGIFLDYIDNPDLLQMGHFKF